MVSVSNFPSKMSSSIEIFKLPNDLRFLCGAVDLLCESHHLVRHLSTANVPTLASLNNPATAAFLVTSGRLSLTPSTGISSGGLISLTVGSLVLQNAPTSASAWTAIDGVAESNATVQFFRRRDAAASGNVDESPEALIPELCRQFYHLGWVTGTGGGISIRSGDLYFIAPSGVQKERIRSEDLFVLDKQRNVLRSPTNPDYRPSACTPLFFNAYDLYDSGACIHTHSMWANLVTRLYDREFRITKQEMIKGIQGHGYLDELVIPIIENTPSEADLRDSMREAMVAYPRATAILVRNHGMYCYGKTWKDAKTQCECYDYLFEYAVKAAQLALPAPSQVKN